VLFGLFPALHSTRPDLISSLKGQSGQPSGARSASRFRTSLATAQIALSMALLVSAGLFTRSLFNISRVDLGLQAENVITFQISPARNGYKVEQSRQLFERVEDELGALPGVTGVTSSTVPRTSIVISTPPAGVTWITAQSCTFAPRRITIGEKSARITVLYQTDAFSSTVTSPMMDAVGAMNAVG
jgi:hypothetical protein